MQMLSLKIIIVKIYYTRIYYPVMSTPDNPNYYLRRTSDKKYSLNGTPYIGDGLSPDSKSFIIYGHAMDNGEMFGTLENYKDIDYKNNHEYILFKTLKEKRIYQVVAAFYTEIDGNNPELFKYYNYCGDLNDEKMNELITKISENSIYGQMNNITKDDKIIMLSTCSYFAKEGRFVLVAKRIEN